MGTSRKSCLTKPLCSLVSRATTSTVSSICVYLLCAFFCASACARRGFRIATGPEGSPSRPPALPAPEGAKRLYGERDCGIKPNSREAAHRSGALRGGVAPLGWVTEDRVLCGLQSGKGLLPSRSVVLSCVHNRARSTCKHRKSGFGNFGRGWQRFWKHPGPVAITRHGETVGYYIPARPSKDAAHVAALRTAAAQLDALLAASGATEDELVNDFKEARRSRRKVRT